MEVWGHFKYLEATDSCKASAFEASCLGWPPSYCFTPSEDNLHYLIHQYTYEKIKCYVILGPHLLPYMVSFQLPLNSITGEHSFYGGIQKHLMHG